MLLPTVLLFTIAPHARRDRRIRDDLRPLPPTPKRNLGFQLPIQGLSSSPKSKGAPKVVLRGSKMAPGIGSLELQNSPSRPEAHPGRCPGTPPSASRLRWRGYLKITRFSHGQIENYRWRNSRIWSPAPFPQTSFSYLVHYYLSLSPPHYKPLLYRAPHAGPGVGGFIGLRPRPPTPKAEHHHGCLARS